MTPNSFSHAGREGLICPRAYSQAILGFRASEPRPSKDGLSGPRVSRFGNPASRAGPIPAVGKLLVLSSRSCPADLFERILFSGYCPAEGPTAAEAHHPLPAMWRSRRDQGGLKKAAETAAFIVETRESAPGRGCQNPSGGAIHQEARSIRRRADCDTVLPIAHPASASHRPHPAALG
jgi:hypothetical protein